MVNGGHRSGNAGYGYGSGSLLQPEANPYPNHGFPRVTRLFSFFFGLVDWNLSVFRECERHALLALKRYLTTLRSRTLPSSPAVPFPLHVVRPARALGSKCGLSPSIASTMQPLSLLSQTQLLVTRSAFYCTYATFPYVLSLLSTILTRLQPALILPRFVIII